LSVFFLLACYATVFSREYTEYTLYVTSVIDLAELRRRMNEFTTHPGIWFNTQGVVNVRGGLRRRRGLTTLMQDAAAATAISLSATHSPPLLRLHNHLRRLGNRCVTRINS